MRTQEQDEAVRTQATGTRVTVGPASKCPYGLGACWGGAYEALKKLEGVAAVRPIPNAENSTADVYLNDQGLPDLDSRPEQIARRANGGYDFRGVEVTVAGTVREQDGIVQLTGPYFEAPVRLMPLTRGGSCRTYGRIKHLAVVGLPRGTPAIAPPPLSTSRTQQQSCSSPPPQLCC